MFKRILLIVALCAGFSHAAAAFDDAKWQGLMQTASSLLDGRQPALAEAQLRAALTDDMPADRRIATQSTLLMALYFQEKHQDVVAVATDNLALTEKTHPELLDVRFNNAAVLRMAATKVGDASATALGNEKLEQVRGEMVLKVWATDPETGEMLHHYSGIRFPPSFGAFRDPEPSAYKPDGSDVSVNYHGSGQTPGLISIYVTEMQQTVQHHIDDASQSIQITAGNTEPVSQGPVSTSHGVETIAGLQKLWEYSGRDGRMTRGSVAVFQRGKYHIKFRATYPAEAKDAFEAALRKVMETFPWPAA